MKITIDLIRADKKIKSKEGHKFTSFLLIVNTIGVFAFFFIFAYPVYWAKDYYQLDLNLVTMTVIVMAPFMAIKYGLKYEKYLKRYFRNKHPDLYQEGDKIGEINLEYNKRKRVGSITVNKNESIWKIGVDEVLKIDIYHNEYAGKIKGDYERIQKSNDRIYSGMGEMKIQMKDQSTKNIKFFLNSEKQYNSLPFFQQEWNHYHNILGEFSAYADS